MAAASSPLAVSFFYLLAQMAGAGALVSLLLDIYGSLAQNLVIAAVAIMTVWVLGKYGFSLSQLLNGAVKENPKAGEKLLEPGLKYGKNMTTKVDFISLSLALVLGTAGRPHVPQRFYTVPSSREARKSVEWAIWLIGGFYLVTLVIGYGAGALVGPGEDQRGSRKGQCCSTLARV